MASRITSLPNLQPPTLDRIHSKFCGFVRDTNDHIAFVVSDIIDSIRNCLAFGIAWKICLQDRYRLLSPGASRIAELSDEFLFLAIYAQNRQFSLQKSLSHTDQMAHLRISSFILFSTETFLVAPQGIFQFSNQPRNRTVSNLKIFVLQFFCQLASRFAGPLQSADRITGRRILQNLFQRLQESWLFFSTVFRPPPWRRTPEAALRLG